MALESMESYIGKLEKMGYELVDDGGVLTFVLPKEKYGDRATYKEIKKAIKELNYDKSWGVRPERKKVDSEKLSEFK